MTRIFQRETLAEKALALGSEFMMCFDDDTVPLAHAVQSLWYVPAEPESSHCGGDLLQMKSDSLEPIVYMNMGDGAFGTGLWATSSAQGIGTGCMMVRLSALKDIPKPWFHDSLDNSAPAYKTKIGDLEMDVVSDTMSDDFVLAEKYSMQDMTSLLMAAFFRCTSGKTAVSITCLMIATP